MLSPKFLLVLMGIVPVLRKGLYSVVFLLHKLLECVLLQSLSANCICKRYEINKYGISHHVSRMYELFGKYLFSCLGNK